MNFQNACHKLVSALPAVLSGYKGPVSVQCSTGKGRSFSKTFRMSLEAGLGVMEGYVCERRIVVGLLFFFHLSLLEVINK